MQLSGERRPTARNQAADTIIQGFLGGHRQYRFTMPAVILESVSKVFRHRPALFNWLGRERTGDTRALDQVSLAVPSGVFWCCSVLMAAARPRL